LLAGRDGQSDGLTATGSFGLEPSKGNTIPTVRTSLDLKGTLSNYYATYFTDDNSDDDNSDDDNLDDDGDNNVVTSCPGLNRQKVIQYLPYVIKSQRNS
jgi:hypothetical protein